MNHNLAFSILKDELLAHWDVLYVGYKRGWITREAAEEYATKWLSQHSKCNDQQLVSLVSGNELASEEIESIMRRYASYESGPFSKTTSQAFAVDAWRYAFLLALQQSEMSWDDKVENLQEISREFGYPIDMRPCSRYGPSDFAIERGLVSPDVDPIDPITAMSRLIEQLHLRLLVGAPAMGDDSIEPKRE